MSGGDHAAGTDFSLGRKKKSREETKTESSHAYLTLQDKVEISSMIDCNRYSKA